MISRVFMPKLTTSMKDGRVIAWKKQEGDPVLAGDLLADVETGGDVMDLEAPGAGIIRRIFVNEGSPVKVGTLLGVISELDDDIEPLLKEAPLMVGMPSESSHSGNQKSPSGLPSSSQFPGPTNEKQITNLAGDRLAPPTRSRLMSPNQTPTHRPAAEVFVLNSPTGKPQPLSKAEASMPSSANPPLAPSPAEESTTKQTVQHFHLITRIAMDEVLRLRDQANLLNRERYSLTSLFVKAAAQSLIKHPTLNVSFKNNRVHTHEQVNIGVAFVLEEKVVSPVLENCEKKTLREFTKEGRHLVQQIQSSPSKPNQPDQVSFLLYNAGSHGADMFMPVLEPFQTVALAIGAIQTVPVVKGETVGIGKRTQVTLSCDHRVIQPSQAASFLQTFKETLEQPLRLFILDSV